MNEDLILKRLRCGGVLVFVEGKGYSLQHPLTGAVKLDNKIGRGLLASELFVCVGFGVVGWVYALRELGFAAGKTTPVADTPDSIDEKFKPVRHVLKKFAGQGREPE